MYFNKCNLVWTSTCYLFWKINKNYKVILPDQHVLRYRDPKHSFLISRQILFRCPSRLRSIACCDFTNLRMQSSKLVTTTTKKMKKQMSQLRAKVKFKHRGDWTPFHNQPWFLATPSCSSTKKLYSLVHSHTGSENGSQSLGVDLTGYPLSPRYWDPHMTCHWFVIGYRKYHKLWRLCSIVTSSVALVLSAMSDKPRGSCAFVVSPLDQICFIRQGVILIGTLTST